MPYTEADLLPISALQHLQFCERQCALIHLEQVWAENRLTIEGHQMHERVHEIGDEARGEIRIGHAVKLRSLRLGLIGVADVVEFRRTRDPKGVVMAGAEGRWQPCPVEYKRGRPKPDVCDKVQLCAQAICLEEMLNASIPQGAIFYGKPRRRLEVPLDESLRHTCESTAERLHGLIQAGRTPPAIYSKKCESCSLKDACLPKTAGKHKSANDYLNRALNEDAE